MLTGTLVTAAGFLPIATAASSTGEYTRSLFQVVTIALLVSWIAAVLFIPYLGDKLLPDLHAAAPKPARWPRAGTHRARCRPLPRSPLLAPTHDGHATIRTSRSTALPQLLDWCLRHRWMVIA